MQSDVQAVGQQMSAAEASCVGNQLVDGESDRGVVGRDDGTRARADDDVDRNVVADEPLQYAEVAGATQTSATQDKPNTNSRPHVMPRTTLSNG